MVIIDQLMTFDINLNKPFVKTKQERGREKHYEPRMLMSST